MFTKTGFNAPAAHGLNHIWWRVASPIVKRFKTVMTCGLTPQKLVLTLCIGVALGIMPLVWGTSLICIMLAHLFRLNHVALQSVNYLLYPVQLALLVPFFKLGAILFPWGPSIPPHLFATLFLNFGLSSLNILCWITLKSLAAWLLTTLPTAAIAYGIVMAVTSRNNSQTSGS
jgi:hypothetical protein